MATNSLTGITPTYTSYAMPAMQAQTQQASYTLPPLSFPSTQSSAHINQQQITPPAGPATATTAIFSATYPVSSSAALQAPSSNPAAAKLTIEQALAMTKDKSYLQKTGNRESPFLEQCALGNAPVAKLFVEKVDARMKHLSEKGETCLHLACESRDLDTVLAVVKKLKNSLRSLGGNKNFTYTEENPKFIDHSSKENKTALGIAVNNGDLFIAIALLMANANPKLLHGGKQYLQIAIENGHYETAFLIWLVMHNPIYEREKGEKILDGLKNCQNYNIFIQFIEPHRNIPSERNKIKVSEHALKYRTIASFLPYLTYGGTLNIVASRNYLEPCLKFEVALAIPKMAPIIKIFLSKFVTKESHIILQGFQLDGDYDGGLFYLLNATSQPDSSVFDILNVELKQSYFGFLLTLQAPRLLCEAARNLQPAIIDKLMTIIQATGCTIIEVKNRRKQLEYLVSNPQRFAESKKKIKGRDVTLTETTINGITPLEYACGLLPAMEMTESQRALKLEETLKKLIALGFKPTNRMISFLMHRVTEESNEVLDLLRYLTDTLKLQPTESIGPIIERNEKIDKASKTPLQIAKEKNLSQIIKLFEKI